MIHCDSVGDTGSRMTRLVCFDKTEILALGNSMYTAVTTPLSGAVRAILRAMRMPSTSVSQSGSVRMAFVAGFGPTWEDLPADMAQAALLLAAHYYEYRHDTAGAVGSMPFGVTTLIERYRTVRLFLGGGRS